MSKRFPTVFRWTSSLSICGGVNYTYETEVLSIFKDVIIYSDSFYWVYTTLPKNKDLFIHYRGTWLSNTRDQLWGESLDCSPWLHKDHHICRDHGDLQRKPIRCKCEFWYTFKVRHHWVPVRDVKHLPVDVVGVGIVRGVRWYWFMISHPLNFFVFK